MELGTTAKALVSYTAMTVISAIVIIILTTYFKKKMQIELDNAKSEAQHKKTIEVKEYEKSSDFEKKMMDFLIAQANETKEQNKQWQKTIETTVDTMTKSSNAMLEKAFKEFKDDLDKITDIAKRDGAERVARMENMEYQITEVKDVVYKL